VPARTYLLALGPDGQDAFEHLPALTRLALLAGIETPCASARAISGEQSNSSIVLDENVVLKLYRRIESGHSPEVELLRALEGAGFAAAPRLRGSIARMVGSSEVTLAVGIDYVRSDGDGWELALASFADDPGWLPERARMLGEMTGSMHSALASSSDPNLAPQEASSGAVDALAAEVDAEIERLAAVDSAQIAASIKGRIDDLRHLVRRLAEVRSPGLVLRVHGDYHLGQVLWTDSGWVVIDFDGEPRRTIDERRRRAFALSDIAGMLRSFAYAADAAPLLVGTVAPEGWAAACRAAFVEGWRNTVDPRILPAQEQEVGRLVALLELRKLLYELRYELAYRPDWVGVPVAAIERMLEVE
jgi:predicted trehalose synthase